MKRCKTCQHIETSSTIESSADPNKSYKVQTSATCKTKGKVHLIECKKCDDYKYVGKTTWALHECLNNYRYDIRNKKTSVAKHFNQRGHSMSDLTIRVIEHKDDDETLKSLKRKWIKKLISKD